MRRLILALVALACPWLWPPRPAPAGFVTPRLMRDPLPPGGDPCNNRVGGPGVYFGQRVLQRHLEVYWHRDALHIDAPPGSLLAIGDWRDPPLQHQLGTWHIQGGTVLVVPGPLTLPMLDLPTGQKFAVQAWTDQGPTDAYQFVRY